MCTRRRLFQSRLRDFRLAPLLRNPHGRALGKNRQVAQDDLFRADEARMVDPMNDSMFSKVPVT
jgi:hypothetical protein